MGIKIYIGQHETGPKEFVKQGVMMDAMHHLIERQFSKKLSQNFPNTKKDGFFMSVF